MTPYLVLLSTLRFRPGAAGRATPSILNSSYLNNYQLTIQMMTEEAARLKAFVEKAVSLVVARLDCGATDSGSSDRERL